ncbi:MAG TPA: Fe2+-dependent dioxygenase [Castellaniella sp.]|uniref:Fe2+-dependent dioxygenase n=1 Tax=Castellaniella sp. TaxID=1955812 RepID=UPI002F151534
MLITLPELLPPEALAPCRATLETASWMAGQATAGHVAAQVKANRQLPLDSPAGRQLGTLVLAALGRSALFQSATLPAHILPPRFNRYEVGEHYGFHIDNAIFQSSTAQQRVRADVSTTIFLSDPDTYEGGELIIQDTYGEHRVKLPAGHAIVYPATSLHRVAPVTAGVRYAAFFWTQSLIRDDSRRSLLLEQDLAIQKLIQQHADPAAIAQLTGVYHNLVRCWADV